MDNKLELMPEFRKSQINNQIDSVRMRAEGDILGAYFSGVSDGRSHEREALIKRLREYEKDSVVAKLIAEMLERERE